MLRFLLSYTHCLLFGRTPEIVNQILQLIDTKTSLNEDIDLCFDL